MAVVVVASAVAVAVAVAIITRPRVNANLAQPARALRYGEKIVEYFEAVNEGVVAVSEHVAPGSSVPGLAGRCDRDAKIGRLVVGSNDHPFADVLDAVFVVALAAEKEPKVQLGIIGARVVYLRGHRAGDTNVDMVFGLVGAEAGVERIVLFLVDHRVVARVVSQPVLFDQIGK